MIHFFPSLDSTQKLARLEAESGRPMHGVVLWAASQTAGHGRTGRAWSSAPGGLYVTACLPEGEIPPAQLGWLPIMAALACCEEIESRFSLKPEIKWPNDILVGDKKLAGFIGDVVGEHYLIGMGLNWSNPVGSVSPPATSLTQICDIGRIGHIGRIGNESATFASSSIRTTHQCDFLLAWLDRLACRQGELVSDPETASRRIATEAEARLWRRGTLVRLERTEIGPVEGILTGLGLGASAMMEIEGRPATAVYCGNVRHVGHFR